MSDCRIEFRKDGDQLDLKVVPPKGGDGERFIRMLPELAAADLDEMRLGQPAEEVVNRVTAQVSEWLLNPHPVTHRAELDLVGILGLADGAAQPFRLVFSTRDIDDPALNSRLFDIPMELLVQEKNGEPFITNNRVAAIVHLLPKAIQPPTSSKAGALPFKVLIVRSNPDDLGKGVPKAAELRKHILEQRPDLKGNLVVDVMTSEDEPGLQTAGRPTKEQLVKQLEQPYDILVYLGHGDVRQTHEGALPVGALLLENEDGTAHDPLDSKKLSSLLHTKPVPVVLLVGCLTAAELRPGIQLDDLKSDIPRWMRGSQGVAQALINGQSGVQLVVGMRYRVERDDALLFLKRFFESLLKENIGDVEAAVRAARVKLRVLGKQQISWAAPTIFRIPGEEPTFGFLTPRLTLEPVPRTQELRSLVWEHLKSLPGNQIAGSPLQPDILKMLQRIEQDLLMELQGATAILMPDFVRVSPDQLRPSPEKTTIVVPVELDKPVSVRQLRGVLSEGSGAAFISEVRASAALEQAGFELLTGGLGTSTVAFRIDTSSVGAKEIPAGILFEVTLLIGSSIPAVYTIGLTTLASDPLHSLGIAKNAVIVHSP